MRILGPLVWATPSAVTATLARALASVVTALPSTSRTAGSETSAPAAASSFSTSITSPSATLYCFPPVLMMAYIADPLLGHHTGTRRRAGLGTATHETGPPTNGPSYRLRHRV